MDKIIGVLSNIAPAIAATLGGPLAGTAVAAIEKALGIETDSSQSIDKRESDIAAKIQSATPADLLALKQADNVHAEAMAKLGYDNVEKLEQLRVDSAKVDADDRASARGREIAVKDKLPGVLAISVTLGFFGILGYMMANAVPETNRDVLNIMLGSLGTAWISVIAYYFGSSAGSAEKTRLIAQADAIKPQK